VSPFIGVDGFSIEPRFDEKKDRMVSSIAMR
jgi:hypothetical protein